MKNIFALFLAVENNVQANSVAKQCIYISRKSASIYSLREFDKSLFDRVVRKTFENN